MMMAIKRAKRHGIQVRRTQPAERVRRSAGSHQDRRDRHGRKAKHKGVWA